MTRTIVELQVSKATYNEISGLLRAAGYHHLFLEGHLIDMRGIGLKPEEEHKSPTIRDSVRDIVFKYLEEQAKLYPQFNVDGAYSMDSPEVVIMVNAMVAYIYGAVGIREPSGE